MPDKKPVSNKGFSADWFMRGALTRIGDTFDRLTGRGWIPSSSLATSGLIERLKQLLDSEARTIPGKGTIAPHHIKLKMQWNKFSSDSDDALERLGNELLAAAADHINDSLYYTYAPLVIEVKPDYFTEGVKLFVSFDKFDDDAREVEMNVTVPSFEISTAAVEELSTEPSGGSSFIARFEINGIRKEKRLESLASTRLSVGRTAANDLVLEDISVSKIHASLVSTAVGQLSVADTGSTNGTFINDERIAYGKAISLGDGDRVKFGMVEVEFEHVPRSPSLDEVAVNDAGGVTIEIEGLRFEGSSTDRVDPMPEETLDLDSPDASHEKPEKSESRKSDESSDSTESGDPISG